MTRTTPKLAPPLRTSPPHQREDGRPLAYDLKRNRPIYTTDLHWNRVWNLELSGSEADALSLRHRGLKSKIITKLRRSITISFDNRTICW
ncbi:hypothetical protein AVEN_83966-1 [Araneus ventricosus]|uniref:Uncharacterized protein n=1 Tax=Araneus ventricosus TaxID=182803 RepID=A0A4Y2BTM7_ARAVE|nr:hypothetical protein AVEN_83966-1 [Araneus ventricosus]